MKAIKKPVLLSFRFLSSTEVIRTIEGDVTAPEGSAVLTVTQGEQWPIPRERFEATYDLDLETGQCLKMPIVVEVERMSEPFEVSVSWSKDKLTGKAGDFKITYGPGDFGVVDAEIFAETYTIL